MTDLGAVHTRTSGRHAGGLRTRTVPRGQRKSRFDRQGRETGLKNPAGRPYGVCPMCSERSSVRYRLSGVRTWRCESCGYHDDENGPLN